MQIQTIPSAWYCEALCGGEYAALAFDGLSLITHLGTFATPAGRGPLYVRITNVGAAFKAIGQSQDTDATQEYIAGAGWTSTPPGPFGVSGAIYDNYGVANIATPQSGIGVNGWRYVTPENVLITGDATYFSPTLQINQFTQLPNGFLIGQNNGSDVIGLEVITNDGVRRLVYEGNAEMPRSNADANGNVAIAFYVPSPGSATAVLLQTTYAELQACPPVVSTPTPEPEPPQPIPPQPLPPIPVPPIPIPPQPNPGDPMIPSVTTLIDPQQTMYLASSVKPSTNRPGKSTLVLANGNVLSLQEDGTFAERPPNTDGPFEQCNVTGQLATYLYEWNGNLRGPKTVSFTLTSGPAR
jgi:hypothetical protein